MLWYDQTIGVTLDTVVEYVITYNGSNATASTSTSVIYGDLSTVNASTVSAAQEIYSSYVQFGLVAYNGGGPIVLASTTNGAVGSVTSYAWPTNYVVISSIIYASTTSISACPSGLQQVQINPIQAESGCGCAFADGNVLVEGMLSEGVVTTQIGLPEYFYHPISASFANLKSHVMDEFAGLEPAVLSSWLAQQPWATSLRSDLLQCAYNGALVGPRGVKVPVSALTATVTSTVQDLSQPKPSPRPADTNTPSMPPPTSVAGPGDHPQPPTSTEATLVMGGSPNSAGGSNNVGGTNNAGVQGTTGGSSITGSSNTGGPHSAGSPNNAVTSDSNGASNNAGGSNHPGGSANSGSPGNAGGSGTSGNINQLGVPASTGRSENTRGGSSDITQPASQPGAPTPRPPIPNLPALVPSTTGSGGTVPTGSNGDLSPPALGPSNGLGPFDIPASGHDTAVAAPIATIGNQVFSGSPNHETIVVGGSTVLAVAPAITIGGTRISLDTSRLVYGTDTAIISPASTQVFTAAGHTVTSSPTGVLVSGENITPGAPAITISGAAVSLGNAGLIIGSSTVQLPSAVILPSALSQEFTAAGHMINQVSAGVLMSGETIKPGASAITISGTAVSLGESGLVIGSATVPLPTLASSPLAPTQVFTAAGHTITRLPTDVLVSGQTIRPGASAVTISGIAISLGDSGLIIGSSTVSMPTSAPLLPVFTAAGQTFSRVPNGVAVAGSILQENGPAITVAGTPISFGASGLIIGTSTIALPTPISSMPALTATGHTFSWAPNGLVVAGSTLQQNGPAITLSGTPISYGPSNLVVGASTVLLPTPAPSFQALTAAGYTLTPVSNGLVIAGSTLEQGGSAITLSGTSISYGPSGLVVGTSTISFSALYPSSTTFVLGGHTFTANPTAIAVSGTTLTEGGPGLTVSGTLFSLGPSGLAIGSSTYQLPPSLPSTLLTVAGQTFTINPTAIGIAGTSLSEGGPAITVDGTVVSLGPSGLVVGSTTVGFNEGPQSTTQGIGAVIMSGFGPPTPTTTLQYGSPTGSSGSSGLTPFTGAAETRAQTRCFEAVVVVFLVLLLVLGT